MSKAAVQQETMNTPPNYKLPTTSPLPVSRR
jgi:hypothetical protein